MQKHKKALPRGGWRLRLSCVLLLLAMVVAMLPTTAAVAQTDVDAPVINDEEIQFEDYLLPKDLSARL